MEKLAIKLKILQKVSNEERSKKGLPKLGRGYFDAYRLNPINPLSYVCVLLMFFFGLIMYGVVGLYEKRQNPFLWD